MYEDDDGEEHGIVWFERGYRAFFVHRWGGWEPKDWENPDPNTIRGRIVMDIKRDREAVKNTPPTIFPPELRNTCSIQGWRGLATYWHVNSGTKTCSGSGGSVDCSQGGGILNPQTFSRSCTATSTEYDSSSQVIAWGSVSKTNYCCKLMPNPGCSTESDCPIPSCPSATCCNNDNCW